MQALVKTSPSTQPTAPAPGAFAQVGTGDSPYRPRSSNSPALSTASTADGEEEEDIESSPALPPLPAPRLPGRIAELLRTPPSELREDNQFGTASWGSPYPRTDRNLRRKQSFSSEPSDDSPIHQLNIDTPFLRPLPGDSNDQGTPQTPISAAAAVLANRVRRQTRGLTEDWIRTHTTGVVNAEPRHWFSDGSDSEHSSLSGSELAWFDDRDPRTPRAVQKPKAKSRKSSHHPRGRSSIETLKPELLSELASQKPVGKMAGQASQQTSHEADQTRDASSPVDPPLEAVVAETHEEAKDVSEVLSGEVKPPATPLKITDKPLPKEPAITPRIKKKVPWKGKNIVVLVPLDDQRGLPGHAPMPLRPDEVNKMFESWEELGYNVNGFDLLVEGYRPPGTDDSQSRQDWPTAEDVSRERTDESYKVLLPDLNAWKNYTDELLEAKLRALGVSVADEEPPEPSISPATTNPSRQASAQYPPLPFSPPIPTFSASSNHGHSPYPFPAQFPPNAASPGLPTGPSPVSFAPGKFNSRQSISLPAGSFPFQPQSQSWSNPAGILQGLSRTDSPLANMHGIRSPSSPFSLDGLRQTESPVFNLHQRHQSLQFLPQQRASICSPRLQDVREDEEEDYTQNLSRSAGPTVHHSEDHGLQDEIEDAEYHLEEQLRNQLEHEDYNPQSSEANAFAPVHSRNESSHGLSIAERFANEPGKPMELHHPRPHSRGHSLTQNFYHDDIAIQQQVDENGVSHLEALNEIPESQKEDDETQDIETNPSNLGSPVQNFQFAAPFGQHQKTMSTGSNPWQVQESGASSRKHSSHGSKPSLSGLNVQAPEFKFNPTSSFTPASTFDPSKTFTPKSTFNPTSNFTPGMYNFTGAGFEPTVFHAGLDTQEQPDEPVDAVPQFGKIGSSKMHARAPSFAPGRSTFSFSTSGPKFRPDAPTFKPFQSLQDSSSPGRGHSPRQNSIFTNINISAGDIVRPVKKSKAIPIVRPSSRSSVQSLDATEDHHIQDGPDGRLGSDESRVKRSKSAALDDDMMPTFAERPEEEEEQLELIEHRDQSQESKTSDNAPKEEDYSAAEDGSVDGEQTIPADTSMSSVVTSEQLETMATTAVPSESSPIEEHTARNLPRFDFEGRSSSTNSPQPLFGEKHAENNEGTLLSATAMPFIPGGGLDLKKSSPLSDDPQPDPVKEETTIHVDSTPQVQRVKLTPKPRGLAASRFAKTQSPVADPDPTELIESVENENLQQTTSSITALHDKSQVVIPEDHEMTFEEIDAVMQQMETDPSIGVNKTAEPSQWQTQPVIASSIVPPEDLQPPEEQFVRDCTSLTPRQTSVIPDAMPLPSTELEDPFVDPPNLGRGSPEPNNEFHMPEAPSEPASDWEDTFTEDEHDKLENRAQFFDGRVNEVVGTLLASRLEPLEKALASIERALGSKGRRNGSVRRDMRSVSGEVQESDADDEDEEEPIAHRSMSPRRDRRMEQIRLAIAEALASQQRNHTSATDPILEKGATISDNAAVLAALQEMKEEFIANLTSSEKPQLEANEVQVRDHVTPGPEENTQNKINELQAMMMDLAQRLSNEQNRTEKETAERRAAEDAAAELNRQLQSAETRVEVEIINRSVFDQRVADLEERLRIQEDKTEEEVKTRRAAEDRLSEVQRLLRISSEEENRLRELVEDRESRIKTLEQAGGKNSMRMTLLEAAQTNATKSQSEMTNKFNALEADLVAVRQDNNHWRSEAERADDAARRSAGELAHSLDENKHLRKSLNTLTTQLEENERLRETWRSKFLSLQEDMGKAAHEVAEENARHIKRDQAMIARQEVLDARLQAEAKTRERLEVEMERLQNNERSGMRAVNECKRLESLLGEMRTENHNLQQAANHYQREFEEARESGASEVRRTRLALQTEIDSANHQVNVVREELEEQNSKLRTELDSVKLEADTAKAQNEMLLEEAQSTKAAELEAVQQKHHNEIEDMQARHERQVNNTTEDAARTEQQLLERLSLSSSKIEHLQDRILHLEDKLEIAKEAATAAVQAAKATGVESGASAVAAAQAKPAAKPLEPPEKISPQALRESIMVLQEQLQAREQRIEELELTVSKLDPNAASKISKRDDEISWLRELLAVRHGDLQDVITALSGEHYDRDTVKDATIRLKANLQMEQQERERAMNGGSAISLPNIAQSIQAATPRVAQTIGPIAAAWGNWRKSSQPTLRTISGVLSSPAHANSTTPSKSTNHPGPQSALLSGLMTPPASGLRQVPASDNGPQPTAFSSTGRRYVSQGSILGRDRGESTSSRRSDMTVNGPSTPPRHSERSQQPRTPPTLGQSGYDSDAQPGDFDDDDFFEED